MAALAEFLSIDPPAAGLQRLRAGFSGHAYDRHRHETYAVGVTETGLQCFHYRGAAWASTTGRVIVLYPDEVHDGHAGAPTGFVYSMLYVDPSLIAAALAGRALPFCGEPVFDDPGISSRASASPPAATPRFAHRKWPYLFPFPPKHGNRR